MLASALTPIHLFCFPITLMNALLHFTIFIHSHQMIHKTLSIQSKPTITTLIQQIQIQTHELSAATVCVSCVSCVSVEPARRKCSFLPPSATLLPHLDINLIPPPRPFPLPLPTALSATLSEPEQLLGLQTNHAHHFTPLIAYLGYLETSSTGSG